MAAGNIAEIGFVAKTDELARAVEVLNELPPASKRAEDAAEGVGKALDKQGEAARRSANDNAKARKTIDDLASGQGMLDRQVKQTTSTISAQTGIFGRWGNAIRNGVSTGRQSISDFFRSLSELRNNNAFDQQSERASFFGSLIERVFGGAGSAIRRFAAGAVAMAATVAAAFSFDAMIAGARELSKVTGELSTNVDQSSGDLERFTVIARGMADQFGTTAAFQIKAFYEAVSAGFSEVGQAASLVDASNRLAIGGLTQVGTAINVLTSVLNSYKSTGLTAQQASDAMFTAMKAGKTTIDELSSSLGNIAPAASAIGVTFDEVTAAVAALTLGGLSTSQAVTQLNGVLSNVLKPSEQATKLAKQLGLEFNAAAIKSKGFTKFLQEVVEKTKGNASALALLFGDIEAAKAAIAFAGQAGRDFGDIMDQMRNKAGATDAAYKIMAETLDKRMGNALQIIKNKATDFGTVLLGGIVPIIEEVAALTNGTSTLIPVMRELGITMLIAFGPMIVASVGRLAMLVAGSLVTAVKAAAGALLALTLSNPFTAIIYGVTIALAALYLFRDKINEVVGFDLSGKVATGINMFIGAFVGAYNTILATWRMLPAAFMDLWAQAVNGAYSWIAQLVNGAINSFNQFITTLPQRVSGFVSSLASTVSSGFSTIVSTVGTLIGAIPGLVQAGLEGAKSAFTSAYSAITSSWSNLPAAIGSFVIGAVNNTINAIKRMVSAAIGLINGLIAALPGWMGGGGGGISFKLPEGDLIKNDFVGQAANVGSQAGAAFSDAFAQDYLGKMKQVITDATTAARQQLTDFSNVANPGGGGAVMPSGGGGGSIPDLAGGGGGGKGKKKGGGGKSQGERFEDIVSGAEERIATLKAERDAIGLNTEAAAKLKYETDLLNEAKQKNINLSPAQREQLMSLAAGMATLEKETKEAREQLDFAKDATRGFLGDMKQGLMEGQSIWKAFGSAASNVLDKIVNKLLDDVVDALFTVNKTASGGGGGGILGGIMSLFGGGSGGGGGFLASLFAAKGAAFEPRGVTAYADGGAFTNRVVKSPTLFAFANGGALGMMGEAGPEAVMPLKRGPDGSLGVQMHGPTNQNKTTNIRTGDVTNIYRMEGVVSEERIVERIKQTAEETKRQVKSEIPGYLDQFQRDGIS